MSKEFGEVIGMPFKGTVLKQLKEFLKEQELQYDENIEYTLLLEDEGKIIGTGSCHGNVLKCVAIAGEYQGKGLLAKIMMHLIYHMVNSGISHYFLFTKPKNQKMFEDMSFHTIECTSDVLLMENRKNGMKKFIEGLVKETKKVLSWEAGSFFVLNCHGEGVGAIVANCNPFTYGHQYLIEMAASRCEYLHVFVLSQANQRFSEAERFEMVKLGTERIHNVILHKASDYMVSPAVFPTYFIKEQAQAERINCMLDLKIFCEQIAPELGITKRFVGTEPACKVTNQYNECMKEILPDYGIEYIEIPRVEKNHQIVSASKVRKMMDYDNIDMIHLMVPRTTMKYVERKMEG